MATAFGISCARALTREATVLNPDPTGGTSVRSIVVVILISSSAHHRRE
jgi:hypothetical protein